MVPPEFVYEARLGHANLDWKRGLGIESIKTYTHTSRPTRRGSIVGSTTRETSRTVCTVDA